MTAGIIVGLAVAIALSAVAALAWLRQLDRQPARPPASPPAATAPPPVPPESAEGQAIAALRRLSGRLASVPGAQFCAELAAVLRAYVVRRTGCQSELLTTTETRETMEATGLRAELRGAILAALNASDRVRFAQGSFAPEKARAMLRWLEDELVNHWRAQPGSG